MRIRGALVLIVLAAALPRAALAQTGAATPADGTGKAQVASSGPDDAGAEGAKPPPAPERLAFHAQSTFVLQGHDAIASPYRGPNSLSPAANARETWDVTGYLGVSPWRGAEVWVDPELDQGFGLSNTLGAAGFLSGEAYKVGAGAPYVRVQRAFFRQTLDLPGAREGVDADLNQLAGARGVNRVVFTAGKFSVGDVFDTNAYAHDPRGDFLNWTVIDAGAFDYAADAWGYSAGAALECYEGRWTLRAGAFLLSNVPNSTKIDTRFKQFEAIGELEERHTLLGRPGKLKATGFVNRGEMGRLNDAVRLAEATGAAADVSAVRRYAGRPGADVNLEQEAAEGVGVFARAGWADGRYEAYEFTDVDRSFSAGLSVNGKRWTRPNDTLGLAGVVNQASRDRRRYLDAGGLGILVGDGRLPHPGDERIVEAYYDLSPAKGAHVAVDYQRLDNPGYNRDRGPANVLALRLHGQF